MTKQRMLRTLGEVDPVELAHRGPSGAVATRREHRDAELRSDDARVLAAERLGAPVREIAEVRDTRYGTVVTLTTGGPRMIVVPAGKPDAEGRTGIMFLDPPGGTVSAWPTYTPTGPAWLLPDVLQLPRAQVEKPKLKEKPAPDPRSRRERERDDAVAREPSEAQLDSTRAEVRDLERQLETAEPMTEGPAIERRLAGLHPYLKELEGRALSARLAREELERGYPVESPSVVKRFVDTVARCQVEMEATSEEERRTRHAVLTERGVGVVRMPSKELLDNEYRGALKFLADHGVDEGGQPLDAA